MIASSLQLGALVEEQHRAGRQAAGEEGAEREGQPEHVGAGDARHDRVRQRIADQRPALQHQIGRQEGADAADQRRHPHGVDHVVVGEGLGEERRSLRLLLGIDGRRVGAGRRRCTSGRSSSVSTVTRRVSASSCRSAPPSVNWRSTPPKVFSRLAWVNTSAVGPAASTVRLISTTWSQKSGTLPRLWVETSMTWPSSRSARNSVMIASSVLHVDAGEGLVEQDDPALLRQRAGQEDALLLAAGQFADLALAELAACRRAPALRRPLSRSAARGMRRKFMWP